MLQSARASSVGTLLSSRCFSRPAAQHLQMKLSRYKNRHNKKTDALTSSKGQNIPLEIFLSLSMLITSACLSSYIFFHCCDDIKLRYPCQSFFYNFSDPPPVSANILHHAMFCTHRHPPRNVISLFLQTDIQSGHTLLL